ncbi:MAG: hypothetical protein H7308_17470 [Chthonomonadaceae bacterium]|nr:hypothetical protein [Chthonomonadaceae bacterium]
MILQTPRLTLRPFIEKDIDLIAIIATTPKFHAIPRRFPFPTHAKKPKVSSFTPKTKIKMGAALW